MISRQVNSLQDLLNVLHSSEYILEVLDKGESAEILLRDFDHALANHDNLYDIYVRNGYVLAIGQKICDHV